MNDRMKMIEYRQEVEHLRRQIKELNRLRRYDPQVMAAFFAGGSSFGFMIGIITYWIFT